MSCRAVYRCHEAPFPARPKRWSMATGSHGTNPSGQEPPTFCIDTCTSRSDPVRHHRYPHVYGNTLTKFSRLLLRLGQCH